MRKYLISGYTIHIVSHIIGTLFWLAIGHSLTWLPTVLVVTIVSYVILFRLMRGINRDRLMFSSRVILGMNILLLGSGFFIHNISEALGSWILSAGIYFNYGFYALLTMNIPDLLGMTLMILLSPMLLYIGAVMNSDK
ncbi:hypothetical protein EZV73_04875 [Acidaminobacter sp. JC074]|uniref:hypothetical protein n=1 Tax=Acidaminobacter sp. JC074 TaxID=2530199 RepID=UPI001F0E87C1|nr:hypothetical protein [Acidaminobacter sp. JC074]MCH4886887.1 hypothetical protein [Acidaminobacter sp. JC074]